MPSNYPTHSECSQADTKNDFKLTNIQQNRTNLTGLPSILFSSIHDPDHIHETTQTSIKSTIEQTHRHIDKISTTISATLLIAKPNGNFSKRPLLSTNPAIHMQS